MLCAYKYRIYPTKSQIEMFAKHFGCVRFVYNYFLKKRIDSYEKDKTSISYYEMQAELPVLKKNEKTKWLKEVNSQSLQVERLTFLSTDSSRAAKNVQSVEMLNIT